jgi:hypothetical protein
MGLRMTAAIVLGCPALPAAIKDAACLMTIFDGEVVHRSERFP